MGIGWKGVQFGLLLNWLSARVVAIVFLINAAISLALAPWIIGREFNPVIGFAVAMVIVAIYLGVIRRAFILQSEEMVTQIVFVIFSIIVCQLVYAHPQTLKWLLILAAEFTPLVLLGAIALLIVGSAFCLFGWANILSWLYAAGALASLLITGIIAARLTSQAENVRWIQAAIPDTFRNTEILNIPLISAVGLVGFATAFAILHTLYLRCVAKYFHDSVTQEYIGNFFIFQICASLLIMARYYFLRNYETKAILILGPVTFDSLTIAANSLVSLLAAVSATWLGRSIKGASDLIDPHRR